MRPDDRRAEQADACGGAQAVAGECCNKPALRGERGLDLVQQQPRRPGQRRAFALEPADMFLGVELEPDPLDQIKLSFEEVDMVLLVRHQ